MSKDYTDAELEDLRFALSHGIRVKPKEIKYMPVESAQSTKGGTNDTYEILEKFTNYWRKDPQNLLDKLSPEQAVHAIQNLIAQETNKAVVAELNRLHRYDGKDYDTELDEIIDNRIEELTADKEQTP